jgi:hypothetical protein
VPFWDAYVIALHKKIKNDPVRFQDRLVDFILYTA